MTKRMSLLPLPEGGGWGVGSIRSLRLAALLSLFISLSLSLAQQPDSLPSELQATERRAADKSISLREREQASDKAIDLRKKLIAGLTPEDATLPYLLITQAAAELARLGRDGSDTAALFCIPLPAQSQTVRDTATESLQLLTQASSILDQKHKDLTAQNIPTDDPRAVQLDQDRTVRVPFFASRAHILIAACSTGKDRTTHAQTAYDAIGKLTLATSGPESIRRVTLGAALLMRASPADNTDLQSAAEEFGWVLTSGPGEKPQPGASAVTRAEAWFGLVLAAAGVGKPDTVLDQFRAAQTRDPFTTDGKPDALLTVLATDAISRAFAEHGIAHANRASLDRAVSEQQALLRRSDLGIRADALRPLAFQKLNLLAERADRKLDLPPAMDLAGAIDAARDPKRRDEAIKRLSAVAAAPDAGDFAADALWESAVLLTQGTPAPIDRLVAAASLTKLARDFPNSPRANEAMSAALAYLQALARERSDSNKPYLAALAVATDKYPTLPTIDTWRYEHARLIVDLNTGDLQTALKVLREVNPKATIAKEAQRLCERVQGNALDAKWSAISEARKKGQPVSDLARQTVLPEAQRAVEWSQSHNNASLDRFRADLADALTESGDATSRQIYESLLKSKSEIPGGPPRLHLGQARALLITGDTAGAFAILRDLAAATDAAPQGQPPTSRPEPFWHAWTLMLEELSARNQDNTRTGTIRTNIKRLESIDPNLGGEPWKSRITKVQATLK